MFQPRIQASLNRTVYSWNHHKNTTKHHIQSTSSARQKLLMEDTGIVIPVMTLLQHLMLIMVMSLRGSHYHQQMSCWMTHQPQTEVNMHQGKMNTVQEYLLMMTIRFNGEGSCWWGWILDMMMIIGV